MRGVDPSAVLTQINAAARRRPQDAGSFDQTGWKMQTAFQAREVDQGNLVQVLPLLRLGSDALEASDWAQLIYRQYLGGIRPANDTGLIVAEDQNRYVGGVFCYRVVHEMPANQTFDCQKIVVPDLVRAHLAFGVLVGEAERMARERACTRLRVALTFMDEPETGQAIPMLNQLRQSGFRYDSIHYAKDLNQPETSPEDEAGIHIVGETLGDAE